jgi:hypothetical protein
MSTWGTQEYWKFKTAETTPGLATLPDCDLRILIFSLRHPNNVTSCRKFLANDKGPHLS